MIKGQKSVEDYYLEQLRLLSQTSLNDEEKCQMLRHSLPSHWRPFVRSARPQCTEEWKDFVQSLESDFKFDKGFQKNHNFPHKTPTKSLPKF